MTQADHVLVVRADEHDNDRGAELDRRGRLRAGCDDAARSLQNSVEPKLYAVRCELRSLRQMLVSEIRSAEPDEGKWRDINVALAALGAQERELLAYRETLKRARAWGATLLSGVSVPPSVRRPMCRPREQRHGPGRRRRAVRSRGPDDDPGEPALAPALQLGDQLHHDVAGGGTS